MLRSYMTLSPRRFWWTLRLPNRCQSSQPAPPKPPGMKSKKFVTIASFVIASAGATLAYAYYNPEFSAKIEEAVVTMKPLFSKISDFKGFETAKEKGRTLSDHVVKFLPSAKTEKDRLLEISPLPSPSPIHKEPIVVEPVELHAPVVHPINTQETNNLLRLEKDIQLKKNNDLEESLKAALASVYEKVQVASEAKRETIAAISEHSRLLKENVDDAKNANWEKVTEAMEKVEKLSRIAAADEFDCRNYLDNIRKIISDGRADSLTKTNPLLSNSAETANKLEHQLDELNNLTQKARNESRIFGQFKDLVDKSRKQFAMELKSILPDIDVHARDCKLTEDELNALIAHAHLKVDELRRQLTEQQLRQEQLIAHAIEQQRQVDEQLAEEQLKLELKRVKDQTDVDVERQVIGIHKTWEAELENRLKRAAAAHSEHLEQVVRTQRQLYDIEQCQKIEEAVAEERSLHSKQVSIAQGKLDGIEAALNSRVAADAENRRSKQFWIVCQNLVESVVHGRKGGADIDARCKPLANELRIIKEASNGDKFVSSLLDAMPSEGIYKGVCTEEDLKTRFYKIYKVARRVAKIDDNGGGLLRYFSSFVQSVFTLDLPQKFSHSDKFDPDSLDTYEILSRIKYFVQLGELDAAVRMAQLLKGEAGRVARDWISDTRLHLETRLIAELLVAHAAVTNVRSIY